MQAERGQTLAQLLSRLQYVEVFIRYLRQEHNFLTVQIVPFFFFKPKTNRREGIWSTQGWLSCCTDGAAQDWLAGVADSVGGILLPLESGQPEGQISGEGHHSVILGC